ncbi:MAG: ABC transporter substrate-binding protein, partial [Hassallia sp.]
MKKINSALALSLATLLSGFLAAACTKTTTTTTSTTTTATTTPASSTTTASNAKGLKIGSLLPSTGDLASIGQQMVGSVPLLVDTVNACGGVNGEKVTLVSVDDQ